MRARRALAALTVPVVALLGLTACQSPGAAPSAAPSVAASSPAAAPSETGSASGGAKLALDRSSADAFDTLRARAAAAASAAGSYRVTTTVTAAGAGRSTLLIAVTEVEHTPDLAWHETVQQDGVNSELVLVDGVFYVKSAATGDDFVRVDPADAQQVLGGDAQALLDDVDTFGSLDDLVPAVRTFRRDGRPVHVDGVLCQPYEIGLDRDALARAGSILLAVDPAQTALVAALPEVMAYRAWVGLEDGLVRTFSIEIDGVTFETLYTRWGEDFDVVAPPAVELGIAPA
ncbi:hypothetical protein [Cellulomonas soli]